MNKQEERYIAAARKAFEIQNEIEINENAGLEPTRLFKGSDQQILLPPLPENGKVTKARKDEAMYILAKMTGNTIANPSDKWYSPEHDKEWQLAEIRKYGTVRICKDKASGHWMVTTYGQIEKISGYYGADINTGEMISQDAAQEFYHRSRA